MTDSNEWLMTDPAERSPPLQMPRSLEDIIQVRCKDDIWDDVLRKRKLKSKAFRAKAAELSQEKSIEGLGQLYEAEYAKELLGQKAPDALKAEHLALNTQLLKLSARLGSLYSFHFVPKPHEQEFNVRPKVSSIALEEKLPTAHAASSSLAPEEVYGAKRGDACLAEQQELTQRERKALRQKKKRLHKRKEGEKQEQAKLGAALLPESRAAKKLAAAQVEKELADAKRKGTIQSGTLNAKGGNAMRTDYTKSTKFFKELAISTAVDGTKRKRKAEGAEVTKCGAKLML